MRPKMYPLSFSAYRKLVPNKLVPMFIVVYLYPWFERKLVVSQVIHERHTIAVYRYKQFKPKHSGHDRIRDRKLYFRELFMITTFSYYFCSNLFLVFYWSDLLKTGSVGWGVTRELMCISWSLKRISSPHNVKIIVVLYHLFPFVSSLKSFFKWLYVLIQEIFLYSYFTDVKTLVVDTESRMRGERQ